MPADALVFPGLHLGDNEALANTLLSIVLDSEFDFNETVRGSEADGTCVYPWNKSAYACVLLVREKRVTKLANQKYLVK